MTGLLTWLAGLGVILAVFALMVFAIARARVDVRWLWPVRAVATISLAAVIVVDLGRMGAA